MRKPGPRGEALIFFAMLDFVFAYAVFNPRRPLSPLYLWMQSMLPLWVWGLLWAVVGAACLVFAFIKHDTAAFMAAIAIKVSWGLLSLFAWVAHVDDRGYVSAAIWLVFAYFVYRVAGGIPPPHRRDEDQSWSQ